MRELSHPAQKIVADLLLHGGYLGGGVLLALNLVLFLNAGSFGVSTGHAVRIE
jgi:hypothetical protein